MPEGLSNQSINGVDKNKKKNVKGKLSPNGPLTLNNWMMRNISPQRSPDQE